jgi:hypothetical protein
MAIQLPPGLYSGFSEVLDSTPTQKLFAQEKARKQAQMDALDEYDKKRILDINSKGVRNIDREKFDKMLADIQRNYGGNKDKIRKGNTPEAYAHEQSFRDIEAFLNDTKERTAKQDAAIKLHTDVFKKNGIIPDGFIEDLAANDKALGGDGSKTFDLTKWMEVAAKPFNLGEQNKRYSVIARTPRTPRYEAIPGQPFKQNEIIEEGFDANAKETIKSMTASDYNSNLGFKLQVEKEFERNRVQLAEHLKRSLEQNRQKWKTMLLPFN